jgi:hypothetical protein
MPRETWDWPPERYKQWLREILTATLLPSAP